ncbi:LSU ribosomal protein L32P [Chthonomonas calidirosea]|uniref:Large ribosomal subunit protein bL32 n=1 Tax=Chthonomonas calidirosea (strain DSM 23976 / ICMP 18418 / T49) TaxID=1303518 RepID=S0ESD7_CHTCT|nr:LSU ribosomal protein L32P [Chthonomonas calidirosea T49]CEK14675.1 LSU ribosomal protein L32P [Chthonomonas calidirosea]CEK14676.1 LSU ribosomal protein L32P [Chthonomonas calidirosea]CEK15813.1 LSU ribosomal protein L32P [Chthonomonas calidirosea]
MALPKRRHSNQRTRKRRTHYKLAHKLAIVPSFEQPGSYTLLHHIDPDTGRYRGRTVFETTDKPQNK